MKEFAKKYVNPFTGNELEKLFETAEIARFTPEQVRSYEDSLKYYRDIKASLDTKFEEGLQKGIEEGLQKGIEEGMQKGIEKGIEEGMQKVAVNALNKGMSVDDIVDLTGLTKDQVLSLKK